MTNQTTYMWDVSKSDAKYNKQKNGYHLCLIGSKKDFYIKNIIGNKIYLTDKKEEARIFSFNETQLYKKETPYTNYITKEIPNYRWGL